MNLKLAAVLARRAAVERESGPRLRVTALCAELGISRQTFYEAERRFAADGVAGLLPRSRRPHTSPNQTPAAVEDLVVAARKELAKQGWDNGADSIAFRLQRQGHPVPSRATINRILTRRGLVDPQPAKRPRSSWKRFEFAERNGCWQFDAFATKLADGSPVAVFQLLDDCTRLEVANLAAPAETAQAALACFLTAVAAHGVPAMLLSDNGTAFTIARHGRHGLLEQAAANLGCRTVQSRPYHPQTCGKNERAHQTCRRWLAHRPTASTLAELQHLLDEYRHAYNHERPHQALGGRTPAQAAADAAVAVAALPQRRPAPRVTDYKVSASGCINTGPWTVTIGRASKGKTVTVVQDADHVTIYDGQVLIRDFHVDPDRVHQSTRPITQATLSAMS